MKSGMFSALAVILSMPFIGIEAAKNKRDAKLKKEAIDEEALAKAFVKRERKAEKTMKRISSAQQAKDKKAVRQKWGK